MLVDLRLSSAERPLVGGGPLAQRTSSAYAANRGRRSPSPPPSRAQSKRGNVAAMSKSKAATTRGARRRKEVERRGKGENKIEDTTRITEGQQPLTFGEAMDRLGL